MREEEAVGKTGWWERFVQGLYEMAKVNPYYAGAEIVRFPDR